MMALEDMEMDAAGCHAMVERIAREGAASVFGVGERALILTGSVARGEGSFLTEGGRARLLGDVEFLLVGNDVAMASGAGARFSERLRGALSAVGIDAEVEVGVVRPAYFARLVPRIFSCELKAYGRVLWGDGSIMDMIPELSLAEIPVEDALRLLFNRMVEHLPPLCAIDGGGPDEIEALRYRNIKLAIDMGGSLLAATGRYETTYAARALRVADAVASIEDAGTRRALSGLAPLSTEYTGYKLRPESDPFPVDSRRDGLSVSRRRALEDFRRLGVMARALLTFELNLMLGGAWRDDLTPLMADFLKDESFVSRAKGWGKWLKRGRKGGELTLARATALAWEGAPARLIYAAATELFFTAPGIGSTDGAVGSAVVKAANLLPSRGAETSDDDWGGLARRVYGEWEEHVKNG